jgi:hypothetical protein
MSSSTWERRYATGELGAVLASPSFAQSQSEEAREKPIQMSKVPQAAQDAPEKALGSKPKGVSMCPSSLETTS